MKTVGGSNVVARFHSTGWVFIKDKWEDILCLHICFATSGLSLPCSVGPTSRPLRLQEWHSQVTCDKILLHCRKCGIGSKLQAPHGYKPTCLWVLLQAIKIGLNLFAIVRKFINLLVFRQNCEKYSHILETMGTNINWTTWIFRFLVSCHIEK